MSAEVQEEERLLRWVYRYLRLFFCPHRFLVVREENRFGGQERVYTTRCVYCGKMRDYIARR